MEQFDLHLFDDDQLLELIVCGKYNTYGKCTIDLRSLPRERTHGMWQPLEECTGEVHIMLTISGTTASETITDLTSYREDPKERTQQQKRYVSHSNKYSYMSSKLQFPISPSTGVAPFTAEPAGRGPPDGEGVWRDGPRGGRYRRQVRSIRSARANQR